MGMHTPQCVFPYIGSRQRCVTLLRSCVLALDLSLFLMLVRDKVIGTGQYACALCANGVLSVQMLADL